MVRETALHFCCSGGSIPSSPTNKEQDGANWYKQMAEDYPEEYEVEEAPVTVISRSDRPELPFADALRALYVSLQGREMPQTVACHIGQVIDLATVPKRGRVLLEQAKGMWYPSWMPATFWRPEPLDKPAMALCRELGIDAPTNEQASDLSYLWQLVYTAKTAFSIAEDASSFRCHRMGREDMVALGLSKRQYNRVFRLVTRLEQYIRDRERQTLIANCARFSKTCAASLLSWDDFAAEPHTAALVAYIAANLGRRSLFTNGKQARAFDDIAEALLQATDAHNWYAVAYVFPRSDVLARLTTDQKLAVLGIALHMMRQSSSLLRWLAAKSNMQLHTMIVQKGDDSATWNQVAGAWNRARDMWLAVMTALGRNDVFTAFLPGKCLRLMAGDVVYLHTLGDGNNASNVDDTLDADTKVWRDLPKPWDVMDSSVFCGLETVSAVCKLHGVDGKAKGWTAPRARTAVDMWVPTYDAVCGIEINQPELAWWLRKVGMFTAKPLNAHAQPQPPTVAQQ